jgi:hypothetical protein
MSNDYLPNADQTFLEWVIEFLKYLMSRVTKFKFPQEDYDLLEQEKNVYAQKLEVSRESATRTPVNIREKNTAKKVLKTHVRHSVNEHLMYNHLLTDGDRKLLGLPIHDTKPTPAPEPKDIPVCNIDTAGHQQHAVSVWPGSATGRAKPARVIGFEVWNKMGGTIPTDDSEWTYVNFSSRTPMRIRYPQSERGKMVYYRIRWVSTRNQPGLWSEIYSAIIP